MSRELSNQLSMIREAAIGEHKPAHDAWIIECKIAVAHTQAKRERLLRDWVVAMSHVIKSREK